MFKKKKKKHTGETTTNGVEHIELGIVKLSDSQKKLNEENLKALHQEDNDDDDDDNVSEYVIDDDDKSVSDWSMTPSQIEEEERARKEREEEKKREKRKKKGKLKLAELSPEELLIREKARQRRKFLCKICGFCFCLILAVLVPVVYYYYIEPRYITMPTDAGKQVFISIEDARKLKYVTILDCRNKVSDASIPNSIHTPWTMFTDDPESGLLSADNVIQTKFQQLGIDKTYTTIVYGDWNHAWGEEGRVYWNLQYMNITKSYILYGGFRAANAQTWVQSQKPKTCCSGITPSTVVVEPVENIRVKKGELLGLVTNPVDVQHKNKDIALYLIDVRDKEEYDGKKDYGTSRVGHLPKSKHWHWKNVFVDGSSTMKTCETLKSEWGALGIPTSAKDIANSAGIYIISYCLGGIRSSFVWSVMSSCGYLNVKNYDGSWWEWSADSQAPIEMTTDVADDRRRFLLRRAGERESGVESVLLNRDAYREGIQE